MPQQASLFPRRSAPSKAPPRAPRSAGSANVRAVIAALGSLWLALAVPACGRHRSPRQMPAGMVQEEKQKRIRVETAYRTTGGTPIAPVVIGDDPSPVAQAASPSDQPVRQAATLNGHPNGLSRETVNRSIQAAMGSIASCFSSASQDPMVAVSFEAEPSGRPSLVRVAGAPPDAERCIRNIVQDLRFPSFEGNGVQIDLPLSFHRVGQPAQAAQPTAQQQPSNAPLFLQP
jgi:hypothetical protein